MAGISFAVGMLVDNAIVVLENIDRHRRMGKGAVAAAYDGASEVWGAVIASTLTTVAVFLPVVFMEQEAGQLFKDIAIAVHLRHHSFAVCVRACHPHACPPALRRGGKTLAGHGPA